MRVILIFLIMPLISSFPPSDIEATTTTLFSTRTTTTTSSSTPPSTETSKSTSLLIHPSTISPPTSSSTKTTSITPLPTTSLPAPTSSSKSPRMNSTTISLSPTPSATISPSPSSSSPPQITRKLRITEHPDDVYVLRNEPATLTCKVESNGRPVIKWFRDGLVVVTSENGTDSHRILFPNGQLFFTQVTSVNKTHTDTGVYHCEATDPTTGEVVRSRNASLEFIYLNSKFEESPQATDVIYGGKFELSCTPPRGRPVPKVKWRKDGEMVRTGERVKVDEFGSLLVKNAKFTDNGLYACIAYNQAMERISEEATVIVKEKPRILEGPSDTIALEHSDVVFKCKVNSNNNNNIKNKNNYHGNSNNNNDNNDNNINHNNINNNNHDTVIWKKVNGPTAHGRSRVLNDKSLLIERVEQMDEGIYVCSVENSVGHHEMSAKLTVHVQPSFLVAPNDLEVTLGKRAKFKCQVVGNPTPDVLWSKDDEEKVMLQGFSNGHYSVHEDGTLIIDSVTWFDSGEYTCRGLSVAGNAYAKARLSVIDPDPRPPPVIKQSPLNQTLPTGSTAILLCSAAGDPSPSITWYKNGRPLAGWVGSKSPPRVVVMVTGELMISDLRKSDSGTYTCEASSDTGVTSKSASLQVESHLDKNVVFHKTPEPSTFPQPPSKPVASEVTPTSVRLSWRQGANEGSSPVTNYILEYFSYDGDQGWVVASDVIKTTSHVVHDLDPDTTYLFLVRSQNSHGIGLPSTISSQIKTKSVPSSANSNNNKRINHLLHSNPDLPGSGGVNGDLLSVVSGRLSKQLIKLVNVQAVSSSSIKVIWEVKRNLQYVEGFHVKYKRLHHHNHHLAHSSINSKMVRSSSPNYNNNDDDDDGGDDDKTYSILTIQSPIASTCVINNLKPYSWYEVRVQPYHSKFQGVDSLPAIVRTMEDAPSASPSNIIATLESYNINNNKNDNDNNYTIKVEWDHLDKKHRNGVLRGYKIFVLNDNNEYIPDLQMVVNATTNHVYLDNYHHDNDNNFLGNHPNVAMVTDYKVQVLAFTRIGDGVISQPIRISLPTSGDPLTSDIFSSSSSSTSSSSSSSFTRQSWFIGCMVVAVGGVVWLLLCWFSVYICKRHNSKAKSKFNKNGTVPVCIEKVDNQSGIGIPLVPKMLPNYYNNNNNIPNNINNNNNNIDNDNKHYQHYQTNFNPNDYLQTSHTNVDGSVVSGNGEVNHVNKKDNSYDSADKSFFIIKSYSPINSNNTYNNNNNNNANNYNSCNNNTNNDNTNNNSYQLDSATKYLIMSSPRSSTSSHRQSCGRYSSFNNNVNSSNNTNNNINNNNNNTNNYNINNNIYSNSFVQPDNNNINNNNNNNNLHPIQPILYIPPPPLHPPPPTPPTNYFTNSLTTTTMTAVAGKFEPATAISDPGLGPSSIHKKSRQHVFNNIYNINNRFGNETDNKYFNKNGSRKLSLNEYKQPPSPAPNDIHPTHFSYPYNNNFIINNNNIINNTNINSNNHTNNSHDNNNINKAIFSSNDNKAIFSSNDNKAIFSGDNIEAIFNNNNTCHSLTTTANETVSNKIIHGCDYQNATHVTTMVPDDSITDNDTENCGDDDAGGGRMTTMMVESDVDSMLVRRCSSPLSSIDEVDRAIADSVCASWNNAIERNNKNDDDDDDDDDDNDVNKNRNHINDDDGGDGYDYDDDASTSSSDVSFLADNDFTTVVAKAAESSATVANGDVALATGARDNDFVATVSNSGVVFNSGSNIAKYKKLLKPHNYSHTRSRSPCGDFTDHYGGYGLSHKHHQQLKHQHQQKRHAPSQRHVQQHQHNEQQHRQLQLQQYQQPQQQHLHRHQQHPQHQHPQHQHQQHLLKPKFNKSKNRQLLMSSKLLKDLNTAHYDDDDDGDYGSINSDHADNDGDDNRAGDDDTVVNDVDEAQNIIHTTPISDVAVHDASKPPQSSSSSIPPSPSSSPLPPPSTSSSSPQSSSSSRHPNDD